MLGHPDWRSYRRDGDYLHAFRHPCFCGAIGCDHSRIGRTGRGLFSIEVVSSSWAALVPSFSTCHLWPSPDLLHDSGAWLWPPPPLALGCAEHAPNVDPSRLTECLRFWALQLARLAIDGASTYLVVIRVFLNGL